MNLNELVAYLDSYLDVSRTKDYCPNGLQVEGRAQVKRIVGGVTASQALIEHALDREADAILVHHGYFWKNEGPCVTGMKRNRLKSLLLNDISLLAYHLPLDMHAEVGNNVQLAKALGFIVEGPLDPAAQKSIGLAGRLPKPLAAGELQAMISAKLGRDCLHIGDSDRTISTIGWCTGAAQGMIDQAFDLGLDAYLSGEISESTFHAANELGVDYFAAGHHATERGGVQALGEHLANKFDIEFEFIDLPNPV